MVTIDPIQGHIPNDIVGVILQTKLRRGMGGDNWNLGSASILAHGAVVNQVIITRGHKRLSGDDKTLVMSRS